MIISLSILQTIAHYSMHFLAPGLISWKFFKKQWKQAWFIMLCTMLVDIDHLLATPIFDPERCSIGFHPLHSYIAIAVYVAIFFSNTNFYCRTISLGLIFHMITDAQDCLWLLL